MKKIKYLYLLLLALSINIACSSDDSKSVTDDKKETLGTVDYEILSSEDFTAEELASRLFQGGETMGTGVDVSTIFLNGITAREQQLQKELGVSQLKLGYRKVNYLYNSVDHLGNNIKLSSTLYYNRYKTGEEWHDIPTEQICLVEHYTITSDAECPSNSYPIEPHMLGNALVVMPDYQGYGSTAKMLHPYLNHNLAAQSSIDALDAAYAICRDYTPSLLSGDWSMCVLGASQGGSNALAVHKYLDSNPTLAKEWNFTHSNCAAGAYSPERTFATYIQWELLEYPVVIPMVLKSMIASYPEIISQWKEEDFYSDKYLTIKPQIDSMLSDKKYTASDINNIFFELFSTEETPGVVNIKEIFSLEAMNTESEMMQALFKCFDKNNLTKGWTPKHPIKLYHSKDDKVVPYENSLELISSFGTNATLVTTEGAGHVNSCAMWMFSIFLGGY